MSSPDVESLRTVPLAAEKADYVPVKNENSGFPFDEDADRDSHFRSQLDDIAKRHPEFAEHLGNFTLRSGPRPRQQSSVPEDPDHLGRFERPFGERFERFGFPFNRDDFDPEQYAQQFYQPHQEYYQQQQPSYQQPPSYQPQQQQNYYQPQPEQNQSQTEQEQTSQPKNTENILSTPDKDKSNIHQSNTIDLGQKQEPVNERNHRSMSAPPADKGQRFTSSIKIPVNQPTESESMAEPQPQQAEAKMTERIIPIHIEGRDEPVIPKNVPPTYSQPHQTYSTPQPERIFGQRPEQFTQFLNREPRQFTDNWHHGFGPEELLRQQRYQPQQNIPPHFQQQQRPTQQSYASPQQQQQAKEEIPIPVQREGSQSSKQQSAPTPQQPPQPKPTPAPAPAPAPTPQQQKPLTPIDQIQAIQKDVLALMTQVENFSGKTKDKLYLYLDEMLTRNLLKLDNVDTQGQENIRSARKEAIKCIERAIGVLEAKAAGGLESKTEENMEVEEKPQEEVKEVVETENKEVETVQPQPMDTEQAAPPPSTKDKVNEDIQQQQQEPQQPQQPMEIVLDNTDNKMVLSQTEQNDVKGEEVKTDKNDDSKSESKLAENKPESAEKVESKPEVQDKSSEPKQDTSETKEVSENQESNLPVAEAVQKFEGNADNKEKGGDNKDIVNNKSETPKEASQLEETKVEDKKEEKKEEKKDKKKGKKKVEKKEK